MPLTIKHKADGSFYEQGDTQGILIPKSLPTSRFNKLATSYTSTSWWAIDLSQIAGTEQPFCTLVGNGIRINETGTYAIYSGKGSRSNANNSWFRFIAVYPDSSGHVIAEDYYSGGDSSLCTIGCECITLEADTIIYLQMYGTASNFLTEQQPLEICKLVQQTPYIIANKGALVSNPVFAGIIFGEDGLQKVYGEFALYNGTYYSINRPDLWPNGITLDFGDGLKGIRRVGTTPAVAADTQNIINLTDSSSGATRLIAIDGYITMFNSGYKRSPNHYWSDGQASVGFSGGIIQILCITKAARNAGLPYDVWCTYQTT